MLSACVFTQDKDRDWVLWRRRNAHREEGCGPQSWLCIVDGCDCSCVLSPKYVVPKYVSSVDSSDDEEAVLDEAKAAVKK